MILKEIKRIFHKELDVLFGANEVESFFNILIKHYLNLTRIALVLDTNISINKEEEQPLFEALSRLKNEEPIQYITGETEFYGLPFKVNKYTLIPRPETEELVDLIINCHSERYEESNLKILDIGTGTGCIAIALAKNLPHAKVYAMEVSEDALEVAQYNSEMNTVNVTFIQDNILNPYHAEMDSVCPKFDIIVSNPPYVRNLEKEEINNNVLNYEPHLALFVPDINPLKFYTAILEYAVNNLTKRGLLFFEINQYLGQETKQLLADFGFTNIELIKDVFGKNRMLKAMKN